MNNSRNEHFIELLAFSPVIIYTCRPAGDFGATSISDNLSRHLGYDPDEFMNDPSFWADHVHPDDREYAVAAMVSIIESGSLEVEYRFRHKDGSYRWMHDQVRLSLDEQGDPVELVGYWTDITDRKEAELEQLRSVERYRSLVHAIPYGIDEIDCSGTIISGNAALHELYGYDDGELIGRSILELGVTEADREALRTDLANLAIDSPPCTPYFGLRRTKSGGVVDVEVAWNYRWHPDGRLAGTTAVVTDISERKRTEDSLKESEQRFHLAVSGADEGLWDKDLLAGTDYWAPRFYELLGYGVDEIEAGTETMRSLLHPDDVDRVEEAYSVHLRRESPHYNIEYRVRSKPGQYRWIRSKAQAIWDESGTPIRMVGFITDITDERALQATLRETQQILDNTPDPIVIVNDAGVIVFVNSQTADFGHRRDALIGEHITTLLPRVGHGDLERALRSEAATDGSEHFGRRRNGSEFPVEVTFGPIETESGTLFAAAIRDVSERRQARQRERDLELKLLQASKLESLGVMAGGIAHDFNNLLMSVLGNADVALSRLPVESPTRFELDNIVTTTLRAAELTKQMLAYSGKGKFVVEAIEMSSLVGEIGRLLDVTISKNVAIEYHHDAVATLEADAAQIRQVVMNLIINAAEAIGEQLGTVTVTTDVVEADRAVLSGTYLDDELPEGRYVRLEIADTGCGMDEDTMQRIFDPFFTTKFAGRGLGLAAVLGIIRGHRGALKIVSETGCGTTFTVLFPSSHESVELPTPVVVSDENWRGDGVVLIVDDDEAVRLAAARMLATRGMSALTAADGHAAVEIFQERADDVVAVLLDMTMPGMDGEATFRELRRVRPDVKVVLTSGFNEQEFTSRFAGTGLAGFVQKPYRLRGLIEVLRPILA